jgi:hypothetical protein
MEHAGSKRNIAGALVANVINVFTRASNASHAWTAHSRSSHNGQDLKEVRWIEVRF